MQCIVGNLFLILAWGVVNQRPAKTPLEGGERNEKFYDASCTLFSTIIYFRN